MLRFFHKLFNPHCPDCRDEAIEAKVCNSCEVLKIELESLRHNNQQLIFNLMEFTRKTPEIVQQPLGDFKPIQPRHVPFNVERQRLELKSRQAAQQTEKTAEEQVLAERIRQQNTIIATTKPIEQLEKELEIEDAS